MTGTYCDHCELEFPPGCRYIHGDHEECPLGPRTDPAWVVGMAVFRELTGRKGIGGELNSLDDETQVDIIETIGTLAITKVNELESPGSDTDTEAETTP